MAPIVPDRRRDARRVAFGDALRHPDHALRSAALAGADARRADLRRPRQRPRRGDGGVARPGRRADRGADALQPVRPARRRRCGATAWFERGCISCHFQTMVVEGEQVQATMTTASANGGHPRGAQGRRHAGARRHGVGRPRPPRVRARRTPRPAGRARRAVHRRPARGRHALGGRRDGVDHVRRVERCRCTRSRWPRRSPRSPSRTRGTRPRARRRRRGGGRSCRSR